MVAAGSRPFRVSPIDQKCGGLRPAHRLVRPQGRRGAAMTLKGKLLLAQARLALALSILGVLAVATISSLGAHSPRDRSRPAPRRSRPHPRNRLLDPVAKTQE